MEWEVNREVSEMTTLPVPLIPNVLYSIRKPEIARLITSCWICSVPSKMSWVLYGGLWGVGEWCVVLRFQRSRLFGTVT